MRFKEISSIFLHFGDAGVPADASRKGWDSNIGTSILPRRKVKKMPKELEAQANEPKTQVIRFPKAVCSAQKRSNPRSFLCFRSLWRGVGQSPSLSQNP